MLVSGAIHISFIIILSHRSEYRILCKKSITPFHKQKERIDEKEEWTLVQGVLQISPSLPSGKQHGSLTPNTGTPFP